jgi:hypothetical protein
VRNVDALIDAREAWCVQDWRRSSQPFHIIRDDCCHTELILAGLFGIRSGVLRNVAARMACFLQTTTAYVGYSEKTLRYQIDNARGARLAKCMLLLSYLAVASSCRISYKDHNKREKAMYGDVYLKDPVSGECFWYDSCSHDDYVNRYAAPQYDLGRFLWVGGK